MGQQRIYRSRVLVFGALLALLPVLAGCGSSYGPEKPPAAAAPAEQASGPPEDAAPSPNREAAADSKPVVLKPSSGPGENEPKWDPAGIEEFEFTERSGRKLTKNDLLGKPWAVCFVFTRCAGPCLGITSQMAQLQQWLEDADVRLVTITVDPKHDTPEVLRRYAANFDADADKWLFLTGDQDKIYHLIRDSFKLPVRELTGKEREPGWEVFHSTMIMHVDAEGRVAGQYDGRDGAAVAALRLALEKEAGIGK